MTGLDEVFDEVVITHNSFVGVEEYLHVPEDDQDGNRHLYTCVKASKSTPPVISQVIQPSIDANGSVHGCGYILKGVEDMTRKSDDDWCFRYFQNQVGFILIQNLPLRVNFQIYFFRRLMSLLYLILANRRDVCFQFPAIASTFGDCPPSGPCFRCFGC